MDSFMAAASDLDSILDQFEQNEDATVLLQPSTEPSKTPAVQSYNAPQSTQIDSHESSNYNNRNGINEASEPITNPDDIKTAEFLLDLSEADFAPSAPKLLPLPNLANTSVQSPLISSGNLHNVATHQENLPTSDGVTIPVGVPNKTGDMSFQTTKSESIAMSNAGTMGPFPGTEMQTSLPVYSTPKKSDNSVIVGSNYSGVPSTTGNFDNSVSGNVTGVNFANQPLNDGPGSLKTPIQSSLPNSENVQTNTDLQQSDQIDASPRPENRPQVSQNTLSDTQDMKPLSKSMIPAPLRPELMHEYVKQGARPKIITNIKTPDSPAKTPDTTAKPNKTAAPQSIPVIGFSNVTSVKVTNADLEALEQEIGNKPSSEKNQPSAPQPVDQKHLNVDDLSTLGERVSPLSKLLNEQFVKSQQEREVSSSHSNELAGLDPFLTQSEANSKQKAQSTHKNTNVVDMPSFNHSNPSQTALPMDHPAQTGTKDGVLPNNVLSKNAKNLLRNNQSSPNRQGQFEVSPQVNDPNHQIPLPKIEVSEREHPNSSLQMALQFQTNPQASTQVAPTPHQQFDLSFLDPIQKSSTTSQQNSSALLSGFPVPTESKPSTDPTQTQIAMPTPVMPSDPPSYQDVRNSLGKDTNLKAEGLREGLTLDFNQPGPRKIAQALPPSPIIEDIQNREDAFLIPDQNTLPDPSHANLVNINHDVRVQQPSLNVHPISNENLPQPVTPSSGTNASLQNNAFPDNDSITPSNETDLEEGEFSRQVMDYSEGAVQLGAVAPVWIPDAEALNCMNCQQKFTFRKRRHHCRACGKVFCTKCCSMRLKLKYMESKEARVCISCLNVILRGQALHRTQTENQPESVPPTEQDNVSNTSESMAAGFTNNRSSLRRPSTEGSRTKETRKVRFSDGVKPGVDLTAPVSVVGSGPSVPTAIDATTPANLVDIRSRDLGIGTTTSLVPANDHGLPPVIATEFQGGYSFRQNIVEDELVKDLKNSSTPPVVFALYRNLIVRVKILDLNCCVNRLCWCFSTKGMATVAQDEIVIVLECLADEKTIPRDIFQHLQSLYEQASRGLTVSHMGHSLFSQSFLGGREHGGFLYLRPSFQCLNKLLLPEPPYLFAVLLQKWETPWAKVFPLRLLLRLGAELKYYPCPLMSVRFRKPVFGEIGHTIMNLLADFKNYQYKLPVIPGIVIHMQDRETHIQIPRNRYDEVMKVVNNSNEHVLAISANFSTQADSHLVCIQNDEGTYHTQAISIQNKPRTVTGASFVVFNGALKTTSGLTAKSSIVEDGLMIQILPETMAALRQALREMLDLPIPCGSTQAETPDEIVTVTWVQDDKAVNVGVVSPIDHRSLEGVESIRIHNGTDFRGRFDSLRWTEVFFLENNEAPVDLSRLAEMLSSAFCAAMTGMLAELREAGMKKLALRVTVDSDNVGYEAGSNGELLPPVYMNELDNELIPVLHNAVSMHDGGPVKMELVFYIIANDVTR